MSDQNPRDLYLADLKAKRDKLDTMIRMIEDFDGPGSGSGISAPSGTSESPSVERHEFVGLSTPEATKRYLRKIGKRLAAPRDIAAALIQGGQNVTGDAESVYANVYSALKRMRDIDVVKQGQEWGLAEVFPSLVRKGKKAKEANGDDAKDESDDTGTAGETASEPAA